jgi:hypothetical protein
MRVSNLASLILSISCFSTLALAQPASSAAAPATTQPAANAQTATELLQTSLDAVRDTVGAIKLDKWKKGSVRDEASDNITAVMKDLQTSLPPLLKASDVAPDAVSRLLPVSRNINALYDVVLRVEEAARIAAPAEQAAELREALIKLGNARHSLDDRIQQLALAQEKQVADLENTVKAQAAVKCPVVAAPATPTCPTTPKKTKKKPAAGTKTAPKSSITPSTTTPPTGTGK